ncbi:MAG: hypothetical protein ACR2GJ_00150 [Gemmatimonadaceae bacterium]
MRKLALLAAVPFALGCAQQSAVRAPSLPTAEPLQVRLFQPTGGALNYQLSEPAYVAIFAVTRGHGISMIFPHFQSQVEFRAHAGLNRETVHGGSGAWGHSAGAQYAHRSLFGHADAYYVIASKYPLPVDAILQSPYMLRSLIGADRFRATSLTDTWDALESLLVADLPDDAWAADVYLNWRDPFMTASWDSDRTLGYCNRGGAFYVATLLMDLCPRNNRTNVAVAPPPPPPPVAELPRRAPPKDPSDRDPHMPAHPPLADRVENARIAEHRPVERPTVERPAAERAPAERHAPPPTPRAAEPRPAPAPAPAPARPEPEPDTN